MNNYQMFRKIQERDNIIKKYSNDTKEDLIDLVIEKDNIIDNLQSKIDKAIEFINSKHNWYGDEEEDNEDYLFELEDFEQLLDILEEDK